MVLYAERGFENTTVAEIADRAGLTERTFFRHYADKREVLFGAGAEFQQVFVDSLAGAPQSATTLEAVAISLQAGGEMLEGRRQFARRRQRVIAANAELRERELVKLASVAAALTEGLHARGVAEPAASLAAETAMAVFRVAFERWLAEGETRSLPEIVRESVDALRAVAA